jgi:hypothetical protein
MSNDILGFRLRGGEDVIAEILSVDDYTYTVRRPAVPVNVPQQNPNTGEIIENGGLTMLKWAPFADQEEFVFYKEDYVGNPHKIWKQLEDYYLESVSRIQIASANSVPKQRING